MHKDTTQRIACYALSEKGLKQVLRLKNNKIFFEGNACALNIFVLDKLQENTFMDNAVYFKSLASIVHKNFDVFDTHIFFCDTGIVVPVIAPKLTLQKDHPAILVCDEQGQFVIRLMGDGFGNADAFTLQVAHILQAQAIIGTAAQNKENLTVEMLAKKLGLLIVDWDKIKLCNDALLNSNEIQLYDPLKMVKERAKRFFTAVDLEKSTSLPLLQTTKLSIGIHWRKLPEHENLLRLSLPALYMGIECKKGTSKEHILSAIQTCLRTSNLEPKALACLATADIQAEEQGLREAAHELGLQLKFFSTEILAKAPSLTPSGMAAQLFGFENISISEGAALTGVFTAYNEHEDITEESLYADNAALILPTEKFEHVNIAVAISEQLIPED